MIAAVLVTFSASHADLDEVISSVRRAGGVELMIVVDTGGRARPSDADVVLIRTPNKGYGAAANVGIAAARDLGATVIALLNDDVKVRPGWLPPLVAELRAPIGAAQPKLLLAGTEPPRINSLGVALDCYGAGYDIGIGEIDRPGVGVHDIEMFTGGAVALSVEFLRETGGFDERYFLYYEDIDLARRGAELGWRYRCVPTSVVEHVRGASTSTIPTRTRYLQERNRIWSAARFLPPRTLARAVWLSVRRLRRPPRALHARALGAGLVGVPGRVMERRRARGSERGRRDSQNS